MTSETLEHGILFDRVLDLAARPLEAFVESYGRRTSFTRPGEGSAATEAQEVLVAGLRTFRVHGAWILNADDSVRLRAFGEGEAGAAPPELPSLAERKLRFQFYFKRAGALYLANGRRLAADGRSPTAPRGWIVAATRFDEAALNLPSMPIDGRVVVLPPDVSPVKPPGAFVQLDRVLPGFDGKPVATLRLYYAPDELVIIGAGERLKLIIMALFVCAVLGLLSFCLWRWVIRPAGIVRTSLVLADASHLQPLLKGGGDFGQLADLVRDLIESRAALRQTLEERASLDRDLHDGVIQAIYSSGMALTHARSLIRSDPQRVERVLDKVHADLSSTIREVRALLTGLAPAALVRRSFGDILTAILDQARATNPRLRGTVTVDEELAAKLSLAQRAQLLQFTRECVSNTTRHGQAGEVRLAFGGGATGPELKIEDDGVGFDPRAAKRGRGLQNLSERALALGASLQIDSAPGRGTIVRLALPTQHNDRIHQGPGG